MSIAVKTADGWQVLGVGEGGSGGSAWGDFTTNGDEQDKGTWGPDAQGRMWKWAEWNEAKDYTVNLTGGQYWVLAVGGGGGGRNTTAFSDQGQPGLVNEGYWEFSANSATPISVGRAGKRPDMGVVDDFGQPSSIGNYGTQGVVNWGHRQTGRGTKAQDDNLGYKSFITGEERQFGTGSDGLKAPGKAGWVGAGGSDPEPGCVIIATVTNEESDWNPPGALPGVGTWATITGIDGSAGTRYQYGDWVAYEWTADGELTTQAGGLVDALIVGGGGGNHGSAGYGGRLIPGIHQIGIDNPIVCGKGAGRGSSGNQSGDGSSLGNLRSGLVSISANNSSFGAGAVRGDYNAGYISQITGIEKEYAGGGFTNAQQTMGLGQGGATSNPGGNGSVTVRVPKAHAYLGALPSGWVDA